MGCFLSCFRAGSGSGPSGDLRDPLVRESHLVDAFLDDEKSTSGKQEEDAGNAGDVDEELRREANYLKSCGTISQTPPEILEVSSPVTSENTNECEDTSSNTHVIEGATPFEGNLSEVFNSDERDTLRHVQNIVEVPLKVESEPRSSLQDKPSCQNVINQSTDYSDSPFPTPLVIRGDIQTPATIYTVYKGTSKAGKRARASKQFIYPVLRPIENKLQWMELTGDSPVLSSSNPPKRRNLSADFSEKTQQTFASSTGTPTESSQSESFPFHDNYAAQNEVISLEESKGQNGNQQLLEGGEVSKQSSEYGKHGVASLSYWLKPSPTDGGSHSDTEGDPGKEPCYEKSVFDVPIFAASSLNWDNDNPTPVLPKAWDGNGIPNTTTKYKEDQKVSWHATPFEERLLKVLSDENHERNISGKLIHLEENAE